MSNDGHLWVIMRYEIDRGVIIPWEHEEVKVSAQKGDALDSFLNHVFTGIRDEELEVVMSEEDD